MSLRTLITATLTGCTLAAPVSAQDMAAHVVHFAGDLCRTDLDASDGDLRDCNTMPGNIGVNGVYEMRLDGLSDAVAGDGRLRLTVRMADLFGDPGSNNPAELFRLVVDGEDFGILFDNSIADEAAASPALADAVASAIASAPGSAGPIDLIIPLSRDRLATMTSDGALAVRLDFREDSNVNEFSDPQVTLTYPVAEGAAAGPAMTAEQADALIAALAAQTAANQAMMAALRDLAEGMAAD